MFLFSWVFFCSWKVILPLLIVRTIYCGKSLVVFASAVFGIITFLLCIPPYHLSTIRLRFFKPGIASEVIKFVFQSSIICTELCKGRIFLRVLAGRGKGIDAAEGCLHFP